MTRRSGTCLLVLVAGALIGALPVRGQQLELEWVGSKMDFDSYMPRHIPLASVRPAGITSLPPGVRKPAYGQIAVGPRETRLTYTILVDEMDDEEQRLWADANGNGNFNDDPPVRWEPVARAGARTSHRGSIQLRVDYGKESRLLELALYRQRAPVQGDSGPSLFCYRQWGFRGRVVLGGKSYKAAIDDQQSTGDFRGTDSGKDSGVFLLIDVNGDGKFDARGERFDIRKPFNLGGTTYEIGRLTASGTGLTIVASSQTVLETKPNPILKTGGPAPAFVARTTDGRSVRFPEDYRGRVVLLDFWATWCGPCRQELPNLKKIYAEFQTRGFDVLGVSLDKANASDKLDAFVRDNALTWPEIFDGKEWEGEVARLYNVSGIPDGFLVDGSTGQILAMDGWVRGAQLRTAVDKALGSVASSPAPRPSSPSPGATIAIGWSQPRTPAPARTPSSTVVWSQAKPTPAATAETETDPLLVRAEEAVRSGSLLGASQFLERRKNPVAASLSLLVPSTAPLAGRAVAQRARDGYLRVGWYYRCPSCGKWHLKLGGAYAVADSAIVTAWHVMTPPSTAGTEYAVAFDSSSNLVSISGVLAASERLDTVVLRVKGGSFRPLPLNPAAQVGDPAFCFSDPLRQKNYFSAGIVNRFHVANDDGRLDANRSHPADVRMNVSTDWGPGSSGAAVLDGSGNVIGHVATIRSLFNEHPRSPSPDSGHAEERGGPLMTLHDAIPARSVLTLLQP